MVGGYFIPAAQSEHMGPQAEQRGAEVRPRHQVGGAGSTCRAAGRGHLGHFLSPFFFSEILGLERKMASLL